MKAVKRTTVAKEDAQVRHVTKAGANLFLELGFPPGEAKRLQQIARQEINTTKALKLQLMDELTRWIEEYQLKQSDAATVLMVSRPRVSDVVNGKTEKFTIDTLIELLGRIGKPVRLSVQPGPSGQ